MAIVATAKTSIKHVLRFSSQTYRAVTSQLRLLPDFIIIGGQRCGTTSFYYYLMEHPSIVPPYTKEVNYFNDNFARGLSWYRAQFPTTIQKYYTEHVLKHSLLTGEASPYYLIYPHAPGRIAKLLPHVKLIVLLRNPIDRAYSHHWLLIKNGFETLSFKDAIEQEPNRLAGELEKMQADEHYHSYNYGHFSYLTRGIYVDQLQRWLQYFPKEQLLLLKSEDLYSNPAKVMRQTFEFLEVPSDDYSCKPKKYKQYRLPVKKGYKIKDSPPKMNSDLRQQLIEYFRPHNQRLKELVGRDFDWDKSGTP